MAFPEGELAPDEHVVLDVNPRFSGLLWAVVELLLVTGAVWLVLGGVERGVTTGAIDLSTAALIQQATLVLWPLLVLWRAGGPVLSWLGRRFVVTDRRLIIRDGRMRRRVGDIWFAEITRVHRRGSALVVEMDPRQRPAVFTDLPGTRGLARRIEAQLRR